MPTNMDGAQPHTICLIKIHSQIPSFYQHTLEQHTEAKVFFSCLTRLQTYPPPRKYRFVCALQTLKDTQYSALSIKY